MATQEQRRQATRGKLLATAKALVHRDGMSEVTTRAILQTAGISRGAMYHHFSSLDDLLAAVYEDEASAAIARSVARHTPSDSPIENLLGTCEAWLNEMTDPSVARILAIDGPATLGVERCRQIEEQYSLEQMLPWVTAAADQKAIDIDSPQLVVRVLNAALTESALAIVQAKNKRSANSAAIKLIRQIVQGLRVSP